jgi:hypothetical protein
MNGCEGFEIAIEMRLHGAADADASERLNAHLATCSACRKFETDARRMEDSMRSDTENLVRQVDWKRLRARVRQIKVANWSLPAGLLLSLFGFLAAFFIGASFARKGGLTWRQLTSFAPSLGVLLFSVALFIVALFVYSLKKSAARIREARKAEESSDGLLAYCRKELEEQIRRLRLGWLVPVGAAPLLFMTAWNAHRAQLPGVLLVVTDAILPLFFIGLGLHGRFVLRPRLQRELEELS